MQTKTAPIPQQHAQWVQARPGAWQLVRQDGRATAVLAIVQRMATTTERDPAWSWTARQVRLIGGAKLFHGQAITWSEAIYAAEQALAKGSLS